MADDARLLIEGRDSMNNNVSFCSMKGIHPRILHDDKSRLRRNGNRINADASNAHSTDFVPICNIIVTGFDIKHTLF